MTRWVYNFAAVVLSVLFNALGTFSQTAVRPSGSGTAGDPYRVDSLANLAWIQQAVNDTAWGAYYLQTANIAASSDTGWDSDSGFTPIGNSTTHFTGAYDGNGYTISGLYIARGSGLQVGMFGWTQGATLKNIGLVHVFITGRVDVGALAGYNGSAITDCYSTGSVNGTNTTSNNDIGGLVGMNLDGAISEDYSTATVSGQSYVGGLVGENYTGSTISNSYSTGNVTSVLRYAGGLVGNNAYGTISNSYSLGKATAGIAYEGGLAGSNSATIVNCFWNTDSSGSTGIGGGSITGAAGKTSLELKDPLTFTNAGWDTSVWYMGDGVNDGYPYPKFQYPDGTHLVVSVTPFGSGTSSVPYLVATLDNLYWITQHASSWTSRFKQTADIDASQTSGWDSSAGFSPIGNSISPFAGTYDGGGFAISSLSISRENSDYVGLFGLSDGGNVKNIGLVNENIAGASHVGGLIGYNEFDSVSASYSTGIIRGVSQVGGLVGINNDAIMSKVFSTASVGGDTAVGGLVGFNVKTFTGSTIVNSFSKGAVTCADTLGGGLVGLNYESIIIFCYSTGSVAGASNVGGLLGSLDGGSTILGDFWDVQTSGQTTSAAGTGESTAAMKTESTFAGAGWDFSSTWVVNAGVNSGYPYLQSVTDYSLPVQATDFLATADMGSVTLSWKTRSEVNNTGFNILREDPGTSSFKLISSYTINDSLKGLGTSSTGRSYDFTDNKVISGATYHYKIQSVSTYGTTKDLSTLTVTVNVPKNYALYQNYPNPFNPSTAIRFDLKQASNVTLEIYNTLGQRVEKWSNGVMGAGRYNEVVNMSRYA
ncbi:MAG TPA: GLUG motif-containing protein, partial [Candidatus Kryptonia bacterium]